MGSVFSKSTSPSTSLSLPLPSTFAPSSRTHSSSSSLSSSSSSAVWNPAPVPDGSPPKTPPPTPQTPPEHRLSIKNIKPASPLVKNTNRTHRHQSHHRHSSSSKLRSHGRSSRFVSALLGQTLQVRWPHTTVWVDCDVLACDCERGPIPMYFVRYVDGFCEWIQLTEFRMHNGTTNTINTHTHEPPPLMHSSSSSSLPQRFPFSVNQFATQFTTQFTTGMEHGSHNVESRAESLPLAQNDVLDGKEYNHSMHVMDNDHDQSEVEGTSPPGAPHLDHHHHHHQNTCEEGRGDVIVEASTSK